MVHHRRRIALAFLCSTLAWLAAACDWWHNGSSTTTPSSAIVEKFSGSLKQQGR